MDACYNFYGSGVDDSAYLRGLIEEVARQYVVDRKRIYLTGYSNGGFMSHRMARDYADLIAGIASLAGMSFLDPNQQYYLHCKAGVRSLKALNFLRQQGFKYLKSVKGGITAWSDEIDRNVPRY